MNRIEISYDLTEGDYLKLSRVYFELIGRGFAPHMATREIDAGNMIGKAKFFYKGEDPAPTKSQLEEMSLKFNIEIKVDKRSELR